MNPAVGSFCFGEDYRDAHMSKIEQDPDVCIRMLAWMKNPNNLFYFCGNVGNGKTYFAAAFYNYLIEQKKNVRVFTEHHLMSHLKGGMDKHLDPHIELQRICEADYFILDDMGSTDITDWKKEMLLGFVNLRCSNNLPTLITSNLNRENLYKQFHPRFVSRIYASKNVKIEVNGPDRREDEIPKIK